MRKLVPRVVVSSNALHKTPDGWDACEEAKWARSRRPTIPRIDPATAEETEEHVEGLGIMLDVLKP
jgi:hypothetical protein